MKKVIIALFLASFFGIQSLHGASVSQLNNWFKSVKKGTKCLVSRDKCSKEDIRAVYQAVGGIVTILGLTATGIGLYTQREKIRAFLTKSDEEALEKKEEQEQRKQFFEQQREEEEKHKKVLEKAEQHIQQTQQFIEKHQSALQAQKIQDAIKAHDVTLVKQLLDNKPQLNPNDWTILFSNAFFDLKGQNRNEILHILYQDQRPELAWAKYNLWEKVGNLIKMHENTNVPIPSKLTEGKQLIESYLGTNPQGPPIFADI